MADEEMRLMRVADAARLCGVADATVRSLVSRRKIKAEAVPYSTAKMVVLASLQDYLAQARTEENTLLPGRPRKKTVSAPDTGTQPKDTQPKDTQPGS